MWTSKGEAADRLDHRVGLREPPERRASTTRGPPHGSGTSSTCSTSRRTYATDERGSGVSLCQDAPMRHSPPLAIGFVACLLVGAACTSTGSSDDATASTLSA